MPGIGQVKMRLRDILALSRPTGPVAHVRGPLGVVSLVGAGPGDPGLITVKGLQRLREADVVAYDRLVDQPLSGGGAGGCGAHRRGEAGGSGWREAEEHLSHPHRPGARRASGWCGSRVGTHLYSDGAVRKRRYWLWQGFLSRLYPVLPPPWPRPRTPESLSPTAMPQHPSPWSAPSRTQRRGNPPYRGVC